MALHEALDNGADEAIMFDKNGFISEGSGENIFIVKDGTIFTPTTEHCLNGITRQSVIQIAKDQKFNVCVADDGVHFAGVQLDLDLDGSTGISEE